MASKKFYASFRAAIKSQGNSFVMLNNAPEIDPDLWELYLEAWLLPVTHYGTSWDYVPCELSEDPRFEGCKNWLEPCKG